MYNISTVSNVSVKVANKKRINKKKPCKVKVVFIRVLIGVKIKS